MRAKASRKRWRRQIGNDGLARIMIPDDLVVTARAHGSCDRPVTAKSPPGREAIDPALVTALESHIKTLQGENEALKERLALEQARTTQAIAAFTSLAERLDALAAERERRSWWRRLAG